MKVVIVYSPFFFVHTMGFPVDTFEAQEEVFEFEHDFGQRSDKEILDWLFKEFQYHGQDLSKPGQELKLRYFTARNMPSLSVGMFVKLGEGGSHRLFLCERSGWSLILRHPMDKVQ